MLQLFIIFSFSLLGTYISNLLPFPMPGSIVGMILLFMALEFKWIKLKDVESGANLLMQNLSFFFIPLTVGVLEYMDILSTHAFALIIITMVTTVGTYLLSAKVMDGRL